MKRILGRVVIIGFITVYALVSYGMEKEIIIKKPKTEYSYLGVLPVELQVEALITIVLSYIPFSGQIKLFVSYAQTHNAIEEIVHSRKGINDEQRQKLRTHLWSELRKILANNSTWLAYIKGLSDEQKSQINLFYGPTPANEAEAIIEAKKYSPSGIHWFILHNDGAMVETTLRPDELAIANERNINGLTPLVCTAITGNIPITELLIVKGAEPELVTKIDNQQVYPLTVAALCGQNKLIQLLLDRDVQVEGPLSYAQLMKMDEPWTPLFAAAFAGNASTIDILLKQGARIDFVNAKGNTPLMRFISDGNYDAVQVLVAKNAKINAENNAGETPLSIALRHYAAVYNDARKRTAAEKIVRFLLASKANPHKRIHNKSLLELAVELGYPETVELLLQADVRLPQAEIGSIIGGLIIVQEHEKDAVKKAQSEAIIKLLRQAHGL